MPAPSTGTPAIGALAKCWITTALPFVRDTAQCFEFEGNGMAARAVNAPNSAIRGTRSRPRERNRRVAVDVSGPLVLTPTKTELSTLIPLILGAARTGSGTTGSPYVFGLAERLTSFAMLVQKVDSGAGSHSKGVFLYEGCVVSRATFSASQGGLLTLSMEIEASTEKYYQQGALSTAYDGVTNVVEHSSAQVAVVPTTDPDNNTRFVFADTAGPNGSFKIGGGDREVFDWSLTIDNVVDATRRMNSLYRRAIPSLDRDVQMAVTLPFTTAEDDLYDLSPNEDSPDMNDNEVKFYAELGTNDDVLDIILGTWNTEPLSPGVNDKGEIVQVLSGPVERKNTSTAKPEIAINMWTT